MFCKIDSLNSFMAYILMIVGGLWFFGRILNQTEMYSRYKNNQINRGTFFALNRWFQTELMGLFAGIGLMYWGYTLL